MVYLKVDNASKGHTQDLHETSHGSMDQSTWAIDGERNAFLETQGHKFSTGDSGAPMLCSLMCTDLRRHVHLDFCRAPSGGCEDPETEHMNIAMDPDPSREKDWITHRLYWARSGECDKYEPP